jgi:immunoglobulin-binding protein 1
MAASNTDNLTISELFDQAWNLQKTIEKELDNPNKNDLALKNDLIKSVSYLEKCDRMLDELHLFSENETIDEISTSELR